MLSSPFALVLPFMLPSTIVVQRMSEMADNVGAVCSSTLLIQVLRIQVFKYSINQAKRCNASQAIRKLKDEASHKRRGLCENMPCIKVRRRAPTRLISADFGVGKNLL